MKSVLFVAVAALLAPTVASAEARDHHFAATLGYSAQNNGGDTVVPVQLGNSYPVGTEVENGDDGGGATLGLTWYMTNRLALELWGTTASDSDVEIDVENAPDVDVASYRTRPLALSLQYHFTDAFQIGQASLTPFVGLGYHHTEVSKVRSNAALPAYAGLEIDSGNGLAASAGLDVDLGSRWFVRGDVRYLRWDTESKVGGQVLAKSDLDTLVYGASIGVRF